MQFANFRHAWPHLRHFHRFWHVLGACAFWIAVCAFMARLSAFFPYMCALMGKLPKHAAQFDQVCQGSAHFDKFVGILQHRVFISGICAHCETTPYVFVTLGLILAAQLLVLIFSGILCLVWGGPQPHRSFYTESQPESKMMHRCMAPELIQNIWQACLQKNHTK
jgi:hypothetical protein